MIGKKTALYALLHMLVDGICALAVFGKFVTTMGDFPIALVYNFCAFVLQMPFGVILDGILMQDVIAKSAKKKEGIPLLVSFAGVCLTVLGAFFSLELLGIGNALFHVGGGVGTIQEDFLNQRKGRELGVFVAPGAFGLFMGGQIGARISLSWFPISICIVGIGMFLLVGFLFRQIRNEEVRSECNAVDEEVISKCDAVDEEERSEYKAVGKKLQSEYSRASEGKAWIDIVFILCCFLVVVFRSYVGLGVEMPWKTNVFWALVAVLAVVFGKMLGGIFAAKYGIRRVMVLSLLCGAIMYLFSAYAVTGVLALLLFNMTMPITLYLLVDRFRTFPGFFFGLLTVALFLGYFLIYSGFQLPVSGTVIGAVVSVLSMLLLCLACGLDDGMV